MLTQNHVVNASEAIPVYVGGTYWEFGGAPTLYNFGRCVLRQWAWLLSRFGLKEL